MRAQVTTTTLFPTEELQRHNHHHAHTTRLSCPVCRVYGVAYVAADGRRYFEPSSCRYCARYGRACGRVHTELEPVVDVWGGTWTEAELRARITEIGRVNREIGLSDDRVTEARALRAALASFDELRREEEGR